MAQATSGPVLTSDRGAQFRPPLCWPLLPVPDESGRLGYPDLETSVRQRIEAILRTAPGEQLMRPEFGAGLEQAIHMPNSSGFRGDLQRRISAHVRAYVEGEIAQSERITREIHKARTGAWTRVKQFAAYFVMAVLDYNVTRRLNFGELERRR